MPELKKAAGLFEFSPEISAMLDGISSAQKKHMDSLFTSTVTTQKKPEPDDKKLEYLELDWDTLKFEEPSDLTTFNDFRTQQTPDNRLTIPGAKVDFHAGQIDHSIGMKLPPKPQEVLEMNCAEDHDKFFMTLLNMHLEVSPLILPVRQAQTFHFMDHTYQFFGLEDYELLMVTNSNLMTAQGDTDNTTLFYLRSKNAGVKPKNLFGLNWVGLAKLFGTSGLDRVIASLERSETYSTKMSEFNARLIAAKYNESDIGFGSWA